MSAEIAKYLNLLEQRLALLRALAKQLTGCRQEFMAMNLDGMYGRIAEQEQLCRQLQSLQPAINSLQRTWARHLEPVRFDTAFLPEDLVWAERLQAVRQELSKVQAEVGNLNQVHAAYLRRTGKTINMLMNFLGSYSYSYAATARLALPAPRITERG